MSGTALAYDYQVDLEGDSAAARVISIVPPGARVLEIGAGAGSISKHLVARGCDVLALELDERAAENLGTFCRKVVRADLNQPDWRDHLAGEAKFDIIIAADVLEHLYDPWRVLDEAKALLSDTGALILSLPHAGHAVIAACLYSADFNYRDWGLLDRTHIRFFAMRNIQKLHEGAGLAIDQAFFVVRPPEKTELAKEWRRTPNNLRLALMQAPFAQVYQVVTKSHVAAAREKGVDLMSMRADWPGRQDSGSLVGNLMRSAESLRRSFKLL